MKKLLLSAAAFAALIAAPVAMADPNGPNDNQPKQDRPARADRPDNSPNGGLGGNAMQGPGAQGNDTQGRDRNMPDRNPNATPDRDASGPGNDNDATRSRPGDNNNRAVNKTVVNKTVVRKTVDPRVIMKFRANIRAPHRYHFARVYVRPAGWYPHRWVFGERLPAVFFAPDFFILDFAAYGLIAPWPGYQWVRYGDDALLIDLETGEVIRVEYDVFY